MSGPARDLLAYTERRHQEHLTATPTAVVDVAAVEHRQVALAKALRTWLTAGQPKTGIAHKALADTLAGLETPPRKRRRR